MNNVDTLNFFENMAHTSDSQNSVKLAKNSDFSHYDADFIMKYADKNSLILDLGSGTGLIINKIFNKVKHITAIEPFENFTKFIVKSDNVEILNKNFFEYESDSKYDLITLFGVMNYLNEKEAIKVYEKYFPYLKKNGKIIIKNQFGVSEDVLVSGYSEELNKSYYAQYRHIKKEAEILENIGYKNVKTVDIYPSECNRWNNTHFWAVIGEK